MKKQSQLLTISIFAASFQIANAADLATTFSSSHSKIIVNNTISYTGSVVNKGSDVASNVQLIFYMPLKNVSIGNLPAGCSSVNTKIICSVGELNNGDSATRTVNVFYTKKSANFASVNAITDSYDTNYSNNLSRLITNVTESTNTLNSPLIPNLSSAKVTPTSVLQGNTLTFTANLDAPLPSGYSVKATIDGSNYTMNGSGTNYSLSNTPNTSGLKTFKTGIYDNYGSLKGSAMTGTFEVTKPNTAPTLSLVSGADIATVGTAYTLQLKGSDTDGNLSNIQITNWGDGSTDYQNATNNNMLSFSHTFGSAGSYTISATAYDTANASSTAISKTVTVSPSPVSTPPITTIPPADSVETFVSGTKTFSYTKIANDGSVLSKTAQLGTAPKDWACTKDNNTGLIWEVKTDDGGLRDKDWYYSWYEPDTSKNGGFEGYIDTTYTTPSCSTKDNCNTYAFTNAVNKQGLCGAKDWRMPKAEELSKLIVCSDGKYSTYTGNGLTDIVYCTNSNRGLVYLPTINTIYFSDAQSNWFGYWSSSLYFGSNKAVWFVNFGDRGGNGDDKGANSYVRLVR